MSKWNIEELSGYVPKTTFWEDFEIADVFGENAIKETYERAIKEWIDNVVYSTELVMVLNHRCWYWYGKNNEVLSDLYSELYYKADEAVSNHFQSKGDDESLSYYYQTID